MSNTINIPNEFSVRTFLLGKNEKSLFYWLEGKYKNKFVNLRSIGFEHIIDSKCMQFEHI